MTSVPTAFPDTPRQREARQQLVTQLRERGITDEKVLAAIDEVPRHLFVPGDLQAQAYEDRPLPIGEGQTISQPYTVAYQTQLLNLFPQAKVMEIGTGSGYQCSVLAAMSAQVYSLERRMELFERNREFFYLQQLSNVHLFYADGYEGLAEFSPFDRILLTAAPKAAPLNLLAQLKPGGIMVLPEGSAGRQRMMRITRTPAGETEKEYFAAFSFVPMVEGRE